MKTAGEKDGQDKIRTNGLARSDNGERQGDDNNGSLIIQGRRASSPASRPSEDAPHDGQRFLHLYKMWERIPYMWRGSCVPAR
jgi:hypothetical protein